MPFFAKLTAIYLFIQSKTLSFRLPNVKLHARWLCQGRRYHVVAGRNNFASCFIWFVFGSPPFTCIYNFIDSSGQLAPPEGIEQFNRHYEAATQHQQGGSQEDQIDLQV